MTPAEALEQVRALAESWRFKGKGLPDDMPDQFDVTADQLAHEVLAILDAVTPDAPVTVKTVEQLKALPSRAAVMDKLGDVGVLGVGGIYYPETAPVSLEYAVKHWGPFTVLAPATPERTEQEREAAVERVADLLAEHVLGETWGDDGITFVGCDCGEWFGRALDDAHEAGRMHIARAAIAAYEGREVSE